MEKLEKYLDSWSQLTDLLETTVVDLIAASLPWIAPILPAWLVVTGVYQRVEHNIFFSLLAGLVVEILGISTVTTAVRFYGHNQNEDERDRFRLAAREEKGQSNVIRRGWRAPTLWAGLLSAYYLVTVLLIAIILDYNSDPVVLAVKALLSSTSVVGAVVLGMRSQYRTMTSNAKSVQSVQTMQNAHRAIDAQNALLHNMPTPKPKKPRTPRAVETNPILIAGMSISDLISTYGIARRTAYIWRDSAKRILAGESEQSIEI